MYTQSPTVARNMMEYTQMIEIWDHVAIWNEKRLLITGHAKNLKSGFNYHHSFTKKFMWKKPDQC